MPALRSADVPSAVRGRLARWSALPVLAIILSGIAVALALVTGWLGGELVTRLTVGVDDGANLDAPSSLSGKATKL